MTEIPRAPSTDLVYTNDGSNRWVRGLPVDITEIMDYDPSLYLVARDLAERIYSDYADAYDELLETSGLPESIRNFISRRDMDRPRVELLTSEKASRILSKPDNDLDYEYSLPKKDSVVLNFRLPKPLQAFWHTDKPTTTNWGDMYRQLANVPWRSIKAWLEEYGSDYKLVRLNGIGYHNNSRDEGYYYLFEIRRLGSGVTSEPADGRVPYDQYEADL